LHQVGTSSLLIPAFLWLKYPWLW